MNRFRLNMRSQNLSQGEDGRFRWHERTEPHEWLAEETALLLCDVWDRHWCRGATERLDSMIPRMSATVDAARDFGVQIIHAPSDTMDFYEGCLARRRIREMEPVALPEPEEHLDPPLPIDDSDGGSDTGEKPWFKAWCRQHPGIAVDEERDVVSDKGAEIYGFMQTRGLKNLIIFGVHANMCILGRSFAIKEMVRRKTPVALVRDLTDAMYNPAMRPYVSHEEGTRLVVEYIEKFWCPTILSEDLLDRG